MSKDTSKKKVVFIVDLKRKPNSPISSTLPLKDQEDLDLLVEHGYFMNRSAALRDAVKFLLRDYKEELRELKQDE